MTNAQNDVRRQIRGYIEDNFLYLRPDIQLGDNDDFLTLGVIDSLGFVELVEEVQSSHGIAVDDVEIVEENFGSIEAIARFVERKQSVA